MSKHLREYVREVLLSERVTINGIQIPAEVARDPQSRSKGLSHRKELAADSGMLFCFPDCKERSFWMKDTHIPLSIAYADDFGSITNIEDLYPHNEAGVKSQGPATYALEMNQGWFDENGISPGDKIEGIDVRRSKS